MSESAAPTPHVYDSEKDGFYGIAYRAYATVPDIVPVQTVIVTGMASPYVEIAALKAQIKVLSAGIRAVDDLIDESFGVYGLHLNGDPAPWDELRAGGRYEGWLLAFDTALAAIPPIPSKIFTP